MSSEEKILKQLAAATGLETVSPDAVFADFERLKKPLNEIVDEVVPHILKKDPHFFHAHQINLPDNPETRLQKLYGDLDEAALATISRHAKSRLSQIAIELNEPQPSPDFAETIDRVRKIFDGTYTQSTYWANRS